MFETSSLARFRFDGCRGIGVEVLESSPTMLVSGASSSSIEAFWGLK